MPAANRLIYRFVSIQHGEKNIDWKRGIEYFVNKAEITEFTIRAVGIDTTSGECQTYNFDVSQPMGASMTLVSAMTDNLTDNRASFLDRCFNVLKKTRWVKNEIH